MLKIFPNPKTIIYEEGTLLFKPNFFVEFSHEPDEEYNFGVKKLVDCIKEYTGSNLSSKKGEDITVISFMLDEDLQKEEYRIDVFDEEIIIRNSGYVSAFRAITTLNQVIRQCKTKIPQFTLADKPDIENRGIMINVSQSKVPEIDELKNLADLLANVKYNQLHLYIDDPEETLELDAYCKERCIELVPTYNCFGCAKTLNPFDAEGFELVKKIFADITPYYKSDFFNIGYYEISKGETEQEVKERIKETEYINFLIKIYELAKKHGKQTMFWDDKLISHPETMKKMPRDIIPLDGGYVSHSTMVESRTKFLAEEGFDFYVCPGTRKESLFLDNCENALANQLEYAVYGKKYKALGYLLTEWSDVWHEKSLVSYIYGSGVSWGVDENADIADAIKLVNDLEQL